MGSRSLSEASGFNAVLKAESFQRTGSYKIRGPLNKLAHMDEAEKRAGVICSSAGNHAQGVALAAALHGVRAVVVMAENATPSKIEATRAYGAEVVLHGSIWDEANEKALELVEEQGLTYIHPFDDLDLITGQGTLGLEIYDDLPTVDTVVVRSAAGTDLGCLDGAQITNPEIRIIGVELSGAPAMKRSVEAGQRVELDQVDCVIDGLTVKRVGERTLEIVRQQRRRDRDPPGREDLRGAALDARPHEGGRRGSRCRTSGRRAERARRGRPGLHRRLRPQRREHQPRPAPRPQLELIRPIS